MRKKSVLLQVLCFMVVAWLSAGRKVCFLFESCDVSAVREATHSLFQPVTY